MLKNESGYLSGTMLLLCSGIAMAMGSSADDMSEIKLRQSDAIKVLPERQQVEFNKKGLARYVQADFGRLSLQKGEQEKMLPVVIERLSAVFPHKGELKRKEQSFSADGHSHVHMTQYLNGLEVLNGGLTLHLVGEQIKSVDSNLVVESAATTPLISKEKILTSIGQSSLINKDAKLADTPRLVYWRNHDGNAHLAWESYTTVPVDCFQTMHRLITNAQTGQLLASSAMQQPALSREVYEAYLSGGQCGSWPTTSYRLVMSEGQAAPSTKAATLYANSLAAYNYFFYTFGRDSWNATGGKMKTAYSGAMANNAVWDTSKSLAVFLSGDGIDYSFFGDGLDVVVHEFGHGLSANRLYYSGDSGAINESISDIYGAMAEARERGLSAETWMLGNEVYKPNDASKAIRYMNDPERDRGQQTNAELYSRDYWPTRYVGALDGGGVHINSGISNLAFYLLSMGGSHPRGKTPTYVNAVGTEKAQRIFYDAVESYLGGVQNPSFSQFRTATNKAALEKFGLGVAQSVCAAWDAVGVAAETACITYIQPTPAAPSWLDATGGVCEAVQINWASSANAAYYQLFVSTNRDNFSSATLRYSGPSTLYSYTQSGGGYYRVKACNSENKCSALSTSVDYASILPPYKCSDGGPL